MPSADCYTDHRLVRAKLAFTFEPPPKKKGPQTKKLQVHRLHQPEIEAAFQARLGERLQHPPNRDPSTQWQDFKTAVQESAAETFGFSVRKNKDWFDESDPAIQDLLDKKRSCYNHLLFKPDDPAAKAAYKKPCSTLQASLRTMQNDWWEEMADKTELYSDLGLTRAFFEALKAIYGSLFNLRRLLSHTKTMEQLIMELLFADDCALLAHTEVALQNLVDHFSEASKAFGLTISLKKTEVLFQPAPLQNYTPPHITIDGTTPNSVEHFTYLGSVMSNDATIDKDLDNRLSKASSSFGRLYKRVWNSHSLRLTTKIKVYRAVVISTLIYGAETWTLYRTQVRLLERFHQRCLRSILNIKWHNYVSNEDVLESVASILLKQQLRWAGHVARMEDSRMPKAVLFGELKAGKQNRGALKKRYKDQKQLSLAKIPPSSWQDDCSDRQTWWSTVQKASQEFEIQRSGAAREKRQRQNDRALSQNPPSPPAAFICPRCSRTCASHISLYSHQRACNPSALLLRKIVA
ncbi:hypothetical protein P5673_014468 [Acropora cervicornis]|uniref:C2H2-type domain-containing protein n=1 Tax=Acropora cervicornis TaxID=6130 RepID=A0AAD9QKR4_ACRCE|nr:hypothetical protein P5673_014468 [Acropora cervicornis]